MIEVASLHNPDIPIAQNGPFIARVRELMDGREAQLRGRMDDQDKAV